MPKGKTKMKAKIRSTSKCQRNKKAQHRDQLQFLATKFVFKRISNRYDCVLSVPSSVWCCVLIYLNLANFSLCNVVYANESILLPSNRGLSADSEAEIAGNSFVWSQVLEDYVLSQCSVGSRTSKDLPFMANINDAPAPDINHLMTMRPQSQQLPFTYHSSAYKRQTPGSVFITKRIGEAVELEPHMRPPIKVVNPQFRPMTNQMLHQQHQQQQQPSFLEQLFGIGGGVTSPTASPPQPSPPQLQQPQMRPLPLQQHHTQPVRTVTENDLYLLGAIEKLVYRVDYLESRIRRAEQLLYYLAGNTKKEVRDSCPTNFTRINDHCYYINSHQQANWKTANSACKALSGHLAEFEKVSENEEVMAYLLNQPNHRGRDYWLGGLNPGLLWIWSNSAKPVNPNMNLTSIVMSHTNDTKPIETNMVDDTTENPEKSASDSILNNTIDIKGQGRCLRLSYSPIKHTYTYYGQECTSRHHYICEYEDKTLDNKIKKITRELKLFD